MLKILDEKEERSEEEIEKQYKGCMFILINYTDLQNSSWDGYSETGSVFE